MYLKQIGLRATREDLWKKMRRPIFESSRSWGADIAIRPSNYFLSILDLQDWRRRCRCTAAMSGIENADDAWARIRAGATLVQAYTGFIYGGPGTPSRIAREMAREVERAGAASIAELVG